MRSPYTVLGVNTAAKAGDIKSAYRQLAKVWHPDQNPDNPQAGSRFAEISHAYKLLIDPELRFRFDNGHIDARGRRQARPARGFSANPFKTFKESMGAGPQPSAGSQTADAGDEAKFEDMVVHIFGDAAAKKKQSQATQDQTGQRTKTDAPGMDEDPLTTLDNLFKKWKSRHKPKTELPATRHQVEITLETALAGHEDEIVFGETETITVAYELPAGTVDGAEIVVPSPKPEIYGDAIVTVRHQEHSRLRSTGSDLHGDHPIELAEAVLGGSIVYEGLDGPLRIEVPEWSGSDTVLKIKGKGLPIRFGKRGSLHVHLRVMLPEKPDPHLKELMRASKKAWYL